MIPKTTTMTAIVTMTTMAMMVAHGGAAVIALALWKKGCGFDSAHCRVLAVCGVWRLSPPPKWMRSQTAVKPHPETVCRAYVLWATPTTMTKTKSRSVGRH